jgi:hypothetical protein
MDKQIEKADVPQEGESFTSYQNRVHDYYLKVFEGYKSPEEVYQFVVDATNKGNAIGAKRARRDAFREAFDSITSAHYSQIFWSAHPDLDSRTVRWAIEALMKLLEELKSGQHLEEKKE